MDEHLTSFLREISKVKQILAGVDVSCIKSEYAGGIKYHGRGMDQDMFAWTRGLPKGKGNEPGGETMTYSTSWLENACRSYLSTSHNLMDLDSLKDVLLETLRTQSGASLETALVDILGYDDISFISELASHQKDIINATRTDGRPDALAGLMDKETRNRVLQEQEAVHKNAPLGPTLTAKELDYPHIYRAHAAGNTLSAFGTKYALPQGSTRDMRDYYEEITIPISTKVVGDGARVNVQSMDRLCSSTFKGYDSLNRMQSLVYPVAYQTNENMLICAPTGAGKTDVALLAILNTIEQYCSPFDAEDSSSPIQIDVDSFKIVYVAPMKALAAEIVEKLGKRLKWLAIQVRELTGDIQLTKSEIVQTQIIVTTPEKWDVVTRKSTGDTELTQKVRLLIIDEVHMLHDERGAVIETLVARTQRQVEATQSLIRIVGLSATLPNFVDVAEFLKVNPYQGLFYFDQSFRPVPLEQHFIGVKGNVGSRVAMQNLDKVAFDKVTDMLRLGHQVMVFVHSRKDTLKTARNLWQMAVDAHCTDLFDNSEHARYNIATRDMTRSKNKEMRELLPQGMGIHNAGLLRSDRNLTERLFGEGVIRVLCCTATLAWGVNLPAAAVIIKGTQLYDPSKGGFTDLGILDVLQIFGRAGRPQFIDSFGLGFICTTHDRLAHYLSAVTQQQPIESRLVEKMIDNLNAEVALGTVTTVDEGVQWLGYTYLYVRMGKNPLAYGIDWQEIGIDPFLGQRRRELITLAAKRLQKNQMIIFDDRVDSLAPKELGRIASNFYILNTSIEIFNGLMKPGAGEADVLAMLSMSGEFGQLKFRENEAGELTKLRDENCPCQIAGTFDSSHGKTNILLQSYISRAHVDDFALVSDVGYVSQNSGRIARALFMIALNRRWGHLCQVLLSVCKSVEKRMWPYEHPLAQFDLPYSVMQNLNAQGGSASIERMREMDAAELGNLVHNVRLGGTLKHYVQCFPVLNVDATIAPMTKSVLRVQLVLSPDFQWSDRIHGFSENYWIWVEDSDNSEILHSEYFILNRRKLKDRHEMDFPIPLADPMPSQIYVRCVSDRWLGAETVTPVSFQHLIRPDLETVNTPLLDLQPLPITAMHDELLEEVYSQKFKYFNPMQTQIFHCLYRTSCNVLLGAPTGSGKTLAAELAMWWAFREQPGSKVVYIAPMKALVRERVVDWTSRLARPLGRRLVELTGDSLPKARDIQEADIIITTPEKWDGVSRSWQARRFVRQVSLVIIDEIHLLGGDRGPILEIIVSRMNYISSQTKRPIRMVGLSTAVANATDLASWLGVKEGLFNFSHSVRPVPLSIYIDGFPRIGGFCPLMQSMNKPAWMAIKSQSPDKPVIVFVSSRRQTRLTAQDLISFCGNEDNPRRFVHMKDDELDMILTRIRDPNLRLGLTFGIGQHHAGIVESDRKLVEELFANNKIQVLIATSTLAWGVNLPAHLCIVKGTQFFDPKIGKYKDMDLTDVLQMLGRAGRPGFDTSGVARIFTQESTKSYYKYFLHSGFPVESSLHKVLADHLGAEIATGTIASKQDALDYLTWTFLFRRVHRNPTYYGLEGVSNQGVNTHMIGLVDHAVAELQQSLCVEADGGGFVESTAFGRIASYYYLSHRTMRNVLSKARADATFEDALVWICEAAEYDEIPFRHNEDQLNTELSQNLPVKGEVMGKPMGDPHVKALVLLQAHMGRLDLPISDYNQDSLSVLDQTIRITQAYIDALVELGYLRMVLIMIDVLECVKQARWPKDKPMAFLDASLDMTLEAATCMPEAKLAKRLSGLSAEARRAVVTLPRVQVDARREESTIKVTIRRKNAPYRPDFQVYAPRFPKPQMEGWFVLAVCEEELLALKRASMTSRPNLAIELEVPPGKDVSVLLVSGCYPLTLTCQVIP